MKQLTTALVLALLSLAVLAGCNPTGNAAKEIMTYDQVLAELVSIDAKHDTSWFNESLRNLIDKDKIEPMRQDVLALQQKINQSGSRTEKEYIAIKNLVLSRLLLLDSQKQYLKYKELAKNASCQEPIKMQEALAMFELSLNTTQKIYNAWDASLNAYRSADEDLPINTERPQFFDIQLREMRNQQEEYKVIIGLSCPVN